jgi:hypothetical protein
VLHAKFLDVYRRLDGIETRKGDAVSLQSRSNVVTYAGRPSERIGMMFIQPSLVRRSG